MAVRVALLALLFVLGCPNKPDSDARPGSGTATVDITKEQARFDAERKPEKVVEALKIGAGSRVADIGAGSGLLTVHLARAVAPSGRVVATDVDGAVLENLLAARMQAAGLADVVERRVVEADRPGLDKEDGQYDAILLAEVDHYFQDPVTWLKTAAKALRPTGRIVISNRVHHRAKAMAAAQKAGLIVEDESTPVPTHFIASFVVAGGAK
jgi:ubiquinone/menaquinone biosynthesis C-methylase UbiE